MSEAGELTYLLQKAYQGDVQAADQLFRLVEKELRGIAAKRQQQICQDITLTGLVDQAFCKLVGQNETDWQAVDRKKFFAYAATIIHRMLINELEARQAEKRGAKFERVGMEFAEKGDSDDEGKYHTLLLDLKTVLDDMPEEAQTDEIIFRIRYFLGCTVEETAEIMGVSESEVKRSSRRVRAWLKYHMSSYGQDTTL